jgi:hypothetical protein
MPAFITLKDTISHVANKDQDDEMPPHHINHS